MSASDQILDKVPARINVPASHTFEVFDKNNLMQAHNTQAAPHDRDVLLDSATRAGNGVDPDLAPFKVVFTKVELDVLKHEDDFAAAGV